MSYPGVEVTAKRTLLFAHVVFALAVVIQMVGLTLHGAKSTMFLEGLALSLFALWVSFFEGSTLLIARRFPRFAQTLSEHLSFFLHLLFLGVTHGVTYNFFA
jgi:hypothetical protein